MASGDIDGMPGDEIVVGAGAGGGPHVRTFKLLNGSIQQIGGPLGSFFAYDESFTGGVNVAVGNYDGLSGDEIITGAGMFGGPHVKVFSGTGLLASFFAFPDDGRLGVSVAAGDVDGDGRAEILTGSGVGGGTGETTAGGDRRVTVGAQETDRRNNQWIAYPTPPPRQ